MELFCFAAFQVAAEIAAPLAQTKAVKMVSIGKGEVGASKLTGEVLDVMERLPKTVEGLTGVDVAKVCLTLFRQPIGVLTATFERGDFLM